MVTGIKERDMTHDKLELYSCKMTHHHSPAHRVSGEGGVDVKLGGTGEREG
jgi:hypothetical protein